MNSLKIEALYKACAQLTSEANRRAVDYIINCGEVNANDTVYAEKAAPESEWERIALDTIGGMLCDGDYNGHVVRFFTTRGITF